MLHTHIFNRLLVAAVTITLLTSVGFGTLSVSPVFAQTKSPSIIKSPSSNCGACKAPQFTYTATATNTSGYITTLNYPDQYELPGLDGHPEMAVQVSQFWTSTYDAHPLGVWYDTWSGHWTIFNEDLATMPLGTSFMIDYETLGGGNLYWTTLQTTAETTNISGDWTLIDNPISNGDPQAIVFVTQIWKGTYDPHEIGVWYYQGLGKWAIFNEDKTAMPVGASFNVEVHNTTFGGDYVQTAQPTNNLSGYMTVIDSPFFNGVPQWTVRVTQVWNVQGTCGCVSNPHPVGVWYDNALQKWTVYTVDRTALPTGAAFFLTESD